MGYLSEKAAYLKGLSDGLELKADTKEGKILSAIIELLDEMALEIDDVVMMQDDLQEQLDCVDAALSDMENDFYELDDELDDEDFDEFDEFDGLDEFDEDYEDLDDMEEEYSFECPKCGDMIYVDVSLLDSGESFIVCPNCKQKIELEFDCE